MLSKKKTWSLRHSTAFLHQSYTTHTTHKLQTNTTHKTYTQTLHIDIHTHYKWFRPFMLMVRLKVAGLSIDSPTFNAKSKLLVKLNWSSCSIESGSSGWQHKRAPLKRFFYNCLTAYDINFFYFYINLIRQLLLGKYLCTLHP